MSVCVFVSVLFYANESGDWQANQRFQHFTQSICGKFNLILYVWQDVSTNYKKYWHVNIYERIIISVIVVTFVLQSFCRDERCTMHVEFYEFSGCTIPKPQSIQSYAHSFACHPFNLQAFYMMLLRSVAQFNIFSMVGTSILICNVHVRVHIDLL